MNKQTIIAMIGVDSYAAECANAYRAAPTTGLVPNPVYVSDIPHVIDDRIWDGPSDLTNQEKVLLTFSIYEDLPCYGLLYRHWNYYQGFDAATQQRYWAEVGRLLAADNPAWATPLEYALIVDWFEGCRAGEGDAIWAMLLKDANDARLRSLIRGAPTAPWYLKSPLYATRLIDPAWHQDIYDSIAGSYALGYGQIDRVEAHTYLARLILPPPRDRERQTLMQELQSGNRYQNRHGRSGAAWRP